MAGQTVTIGSSISITGGMLVKCNLPYVLEVDGIEWSPISTSNEGDLYILSTSGEIVIYVAAERVFFFENNIVSDFDIRQIGYRQYEGNEEITHLYAQPRYIQAQFAQNCDKVWISFNGVDKTLQELVDLGFSTNNGSITSTKSTNSVVVEVTDLNVNEYCAIYCGNVLLVFLTSVS